MMPCREEGLGREVKEGEDGDDQTPPTRARKGTLHGARGESGGRPAGIWGPGEPPCKGPEGSWLLLGPHV